MRFVLAALVVLFALPAIAHDQFGNANWIANGHYTSPIDGSHCCGIADCAQVDADDVTEHAAGYDLRGRVTYGSGKGAVHQWIDEFVPRREVQVSRDGNYWRCKFTHGARAGARRCFFAPPPAT